MKAMILAAGFGTRLRPLTRLRPKALLPVGNRPVMDRVLAYLKHWGIREVIVNAHHHAEQIVRHVDAYGSNEMDVQVRVEKTILGTGGGLKNAEDFWDAEPFVVINGDVLTDIDLRKAFEPHAASGAMATLVLHRCEPYNQVLLDGSGRIADIGTESQPERHAFTGIHILNPEALRHIPQGIYSDIIDCYRRLIDSGAPVRGYVSSWHYWCDMGSFAGYVRANREEVKRSGMPRILGADCTVDPAVRFQDWAVVGAGCVLERDAEIARSVLWENCRVDHGVRVFDRILTGVEDVDRELCKRASRVAESGGEA